MLGKALASLRQRGVAEPELLLGGIGGMRTRAADVDRMLLAVLASAPSLNTVSPLAARLATNSPPDRRRRCSGGVHNPSCILFHRCPRQANPLLVVNELVCKPSKELEATCRPVVRMDDLLEKKVGINADNSEDSEVEPLVPMFGGKIAVHPQLVGADSVVPVDDAGALVELHNRPWLGDLDNDLVWWCPTGLDKLAEALAKDLPPLSNAARCRDKK
jgi:hypothetical protein